MRRTPLVTLLALLAGGCLHDTEPAQLRGEIVRQGAYFVVTECTTGKRYELDLVAQAYVALDRHVREVESALPGSPILVELGGKALPPTGHTPADGVFDVYQRYDVRAGSCR
jgi:hypothetical protein